MNNIESKNDLDFNLVDHGTIFEFQAANNEALAFAKIRLGVMGWQWRNNSFFVGYEKVSTYCAFLINNGFKLH